MTKPLTDTANRPLQDLRLSVMDRCNFRCPYCMPREAFGDGYRFLSSQERLSFPEMLRLARLFATLGVRKLRITGGEPLLRAGLADFIGDLSLVPGIEDIALTTNGVLLKQHAAELSAAGLKRVTVSLDSLDPVVFRQLSGGFDGLPQVLEGIEAALLAGLAPVKLNCVVQRGINEAGVLDLVERFRGTGVTVRFIEYMDVGERHRWDIAKLVPTKELHARIHERWPLMPLEPTHRGEVAERHAFADGQGEVGFISSVSQPFCGGCTRARLSSAGVLYTCLFATHGIDLRAPLRAGASDAELLDLVGGRWRSREDRYSELRSEIRRQSRQDARASSSDQATTDPRKVEMHHIGG